MSDTKQKEVTEQVTQGLCNKRENMSIKYADQFNEGFWGNAHQSFLAGWDARELEVDALNAEIDRLKEFELKYKELCK